MKATKRSHIAVAGLVAAVLPFGLAAVVEAEEAPIGAVVGAGASSALPGRYIVVLRDAAGPSALQLTAAHGGVVTHEYDTGFAGFAAEMSEEQAKRLAADPAVAYVEQDDVVTAFDDPGAQAIREDAEWGIDRIDQRRTGLDGKYHFIDKGAGVRIYVLDTGLRVTHNEFDGQWGANRASAPADFVDNDDNASDCSGHGTHVAGIAAGATYGVAPASRVIGVRVLDCEGRGSDSDIIAGLNYVGQHGVRPAVVNLSLGGNASPALDAAVQGLIDDGFHVVVAAGNLGVTTEWTSPARVPGAITVAMSDRYDRRPYWSNYGSGVDLHAPGIGIKSAHKQSDSATHVASGTSMAAPHVAGVVARFLTDHPTRTPGAVAYALSRNANDNAVTTVTQPPDDWDPGSPITDPDNPSPTENGGGIGTESTTTKLLHASIDRQPAADCAISRSAGGESLPDNPLTVHTTSFTISGCGNVGVWGPMSIKYDITHPRPSDLSIRLRGPNGTVYLLRNAGDSSSSRNVALWRDVVQSRDGEWRFDVVDHVEGSAGYLGNVRITF